MLSRNQIQKLRQALHDYEQEKWRIVAQKVGTGFTSAACREKASELKHLQSPGEAPASDLGDAEY